MRGLPPNVVILSFEGPDPYSMVGGLGTRVTEMSLALSEGGITTSLLFIGDPAREPVERQSPHLQYLRWGQWISAYHPDGVYDGEWEKANDFTSSVPPFVVESIVAPAAERGEAVLVIAEDWQTARAAIALDRRLRESGLRDRVSLLWNANNTYGFYSVDWNALQRAATISTVSRYMRFELERCGVEPLVIPNGIPERLLDGASSSLIKLAEAALTRRPLLIKIGRFDEDKRWMQAIEAFALLRARQPEAMLIVRGGREPYGDQIFARARELGVAVEDVTVASRAPEAMIAALGAARGSIVNVRSFVPEEALLALYNVADAVLANSGREPFGLVGLEVMAAGGLAVTGSTGEDYVRPFENAIACDTGDPRELAAYLDQLAADPVLATRIRAAGVATAHDYTWDKVLQLLARKLPVSP
jgi:glycosyltransferase involved in cell wall biosynthesis